MRRLSTLRGAVLGIGLAAASAAWGQSGAYWQYVKTESGVVPYGGGCYPATAVPAEGAIRVTITHCGTPPAASTSYLLEWTPPPPALVLPVSAPVDFKLKATITSNLTASWTLPGDMSACFQAYATAPGTSGCSPSVGPSGNPHIAGETFLWDNLAKPAAEQVKAPPAWWGNDPRYAHPTGQIRMNFLASASSTWWWSYVYKLVEPKPKVSATASGARFGSTIAPGSWVTIKGELLSDRTRVWGSADFSGGRLPTSLDGVQVTIDGKAAYIYYISPAQVNVLAPDDIGFGSIRVEVKNAYGTSDSFTATAQRYAPSAFTFDPDGGKHALAHTPDGVYLARAGLFAGVTTRPVRPEEIFILYATGLGPTTPALPADRVPTAAAPTADPVTVRIGGVAATVLWAGKIGPGLYQLNVQAAAATPTGEQPLVIEAGGVASPAGTVLTVGR